MKKHVLFAALLALIAQSALAMGELRGGTRYEANLNNAGIVGLSSLK